MFCGRMIGDEWKIFGVFIMIFVIILKFLLENFKILGREEGLFVFREF